MKICWDNLNRMKYVPDKGYWIGPSREIFIYKEGCEYCGDPFFVKKSGYRFRPGIFCTIQCRNYNGRGKPTSDEVKKKMSKSNSGNKHPNWRGDSKRTYCPIWQDEDFKESIRDRDNYKCQNPDCWGTSDNLRIHHINYKVKDCHPSNLVVLCNSCNLRANYNRWFWYGIYQGIMYSRGIRSPLL